MCPIFFGFYYIIIGISPINKFIVKEMEKYKYLPNLKSPLKKDKNSINKIKKSAVIIVMSPSI